MSRSRAALSPCCHFTSNSVTPSTDDASELVSEYVGSGPTEKPPAGRDLVRCLQYIREQVVYGDFFQCTNSPKGLDKDFSLTIVGLYPFWAVNRSGRESWRFFDPLIGGCFWLNFSNGRRRESWRFF